MGTDPAVLPLETSEGDFSVIGQRFGDTLVFSFFRIKEPVSQ